jgi:hypothetical protein
MTDERLPRIIDWIGDVPIFHGERDDSQACLCGEPNYLACPEFLFDSPLLRLEVIAKATATEEER